MKKLVRVEFEYEDGSVKELDIVSSENFQKNLDMTAFMGLRGFKFHPIVWKDIRDSRL